MGKGLSTSLEGTWTLWEWTKMGEPKVERIKVWAKCARRFGRLVAGCVLHQGESL